MGDQSDHGLNVKVTITQDFDTPEAAAVFLARIGNPAHVADTLGAAPEPTRKPRSDAGQKREPYKPRATTTDTAPAMTPEAPLKPADTGGSVSAISSAPAPSEQQSTASPQPSPGNRAATAPVSEDFPATLDGARLALKALSKTKGKGMDATLAALKTYGVVRVTDIPKDKYAEIIAYALKDSSPEGIKEAIAEVTKKAPAK